MDPSPPQLAAFATDAGVRRLGRYFPLGPGGVVLNDARPNAIDPDWRAAAVRVTARVREELEPRAVYLRGSVARGLAVPGRSDIDLVLVLEPGRADAAALVDRLRRDADALLPEAARAGGVDLELTVPDRLLSGRTPEALAVATQSVLLYGEPFHERIRPFRLGRETALGLRGLRRDLRRVASAPASPAVLAWSAARVVRAGLELAAVPAARYTCDLGLCWETAAGVFPELRAGLEHALVAAVDPRRADGSGAARRLERVVGTAESLLAHPASGPLLDPEVAPVVGG